MSQSLSLQSERQIRNQVGAAQRPRWPWLRTLWRSKPAVVGAMVILAIVFSAIFAPAVAPYDPNSQQYGFLEAPTAAHWLGTDDLGRDLFSRIVHGARISLFVGIITVLLAMMIGVLLGLLAGYYGGWIDNIIMRYIDLQWAFPNFIIA
ncbi:MAG: ABC transporter permease, partial [Caldilineaceae bacterium]|nr:ABC transporter permease [Caldilineaceae bacterium]